MPTNTYYNLRDGTDPVPVYTTTTPAAAANNTQTAAPAAGATTTAPAGTPVASNGTRNSYLHDEYARGTADPNAAAANAWVDSILARAGAGTGDPNDPNPNQTGETDRYGNPIGFDYNRFYGRGGSSTAADKKTFEVPTLPSAASQEDYINAMYAANEAAARERLQAEYENNLAAAGRQEEKLAPSYDAAANQAAAQAAINRQNFNEMAAASGLNTGTASQAQLAQNNALLGNISEIRRAQADAQAELDFQRTQMEAQYQQAIREAVAQNDLQKAQALYQEAKRVDESLVNTAVNQANMDWTVWNALYNKR